MTKVILAGICIQKYASTFTMKMQECKALCEACHMEVVETITQNTKVLDTRTAFRKGKLEELAQIVQESDVDLVVFYNTLSIPMTMQIASVIQCDVIDRTALILRIFASRAKTKQAKLQVEMARLQYDLPRILNEEIDVDRQRGGSITNRGAGEMRSSIIQRKYQQRIQTLKKELDKIEKQRHQDERRRSKTLLPRVALIGYTNAGKSSFMNYVLQHTNAQGTQVLQEDMLFATLDTSVRKVTTNQKSFLLYDTVGFVSDLPHSLIEAFHSTLSAAKEADLLVEVVDVSDSCYEEKMEVTKQTLKEIHADEIPVIHMYNKIDQCDNPQHIEGMCVSCLTGENMKEAIEKIINVIYPEEESVLCYLPYDKINMLDTYKQAIHIHVNQQDENGMVLALKGPKKYIQAFWKYRIERNMYE